MATEDHGIDNVKYRLLTTDEKIRILNRIYTQPSEILGNNSVSALINSQSPRLNFIKYPSSPSSEKISSLPEEMPEYSLTAADPLVTEFQDDEIGDANYSPSYSDDESVQDSIPSDSSGEFDSSEQEESGDEHIVEDL
jgi:hypothetical protein